MSTVIPERTERKYEPYHDYKDSGVEWLGGIPTHWDAKRLRFLTRINPSKGEIKGLPPSLEISFVPMEDVGCGVLNMEKTQELDSVSEGYTYFCDGDVLVAKITPCFENGKGAIGEGLLNGIGFGTTELHVIRSTPDLNRRFLLYITVSYAFRNIGESEMYGAAGQKRVPDKFIRDFICSYPSQREQQAIADFLDRETTRIDELIARNQRLIELLHEQCTALITHAVTKGLNSDAPMKDSGVEWMGEIPTHWEVKPAKRIFKVFNGSTPKSSEPAYWDGDIPWVTPEDLGKLASSEISETNRYITQAGYESCGTNLVPAGSLVLSTRAPIGHLAIATVALCTNQGCRALVPRSNIRSRFSYYVLYASRQELVSLGQGSTFMELGKSELETVVLPFPKTEEQQAIADYLDRETSRIDSLISRINQAIEKLQEYRTALITAAVTGKIDVRRHVS